MFDSYHDYDNRTIVNVKTKEVSPQEAADFYKKHLDEFKSKIVAEGTYTCFNTTSKWFCYPDWHTDDLKVYTKFKLNGMEFEFDSSLNVSRIRYSDMESLRDLIQSRIVDKLTQKIRDALLREGEFTLMEAIVDYRK